MGYCPDTLCKGRADSWRHGTPSALLQGCPRARAGQGCSSAERGLCLAAALTSAHQPSHEPQLWASGPPCHFLLHHAEGQCKNILSLAEGQQSEHSSELGTVVGGSEDVPVLCQLQIKEPPLPPPPPLSFLS